jgi:hypothetical protein
MRFVGSPITTGRCSGNRTKRSSPMIYLLRNQSLSHQSCPCHPSQTQKHGTVDGEV